MKFIGKERVLTIQLESLDDKGEPIPYWTKTVSSFEEFDEEFKHIAEHAREDAPNMDVIFEGDFLFGDIIDAKYDPTLVADVMMEVVNQAHTAVLNGEYGNNREAIEKFLAEENEIVYAEGGYRNNVDALKAFFLKYQENVFEK